MSKSKTKQIEVQIMGQNYLLACPEGGESALLDAVERVDTAMCRIRNAGRVKARDRIAVLASLNLAVELSQLEARLSRLNPAPAQHSFNPQRIANDLAATEAALQTQARIHHLVRRLDEALATQVGPTEAEPQTDLPPI